MEFMVEFTLKISKIVKSFVAVSTYALAVLFFNMSLVEVFHMESIGKHALLFDPRMCC